MREQGEFKTYIPLCPPNFPEALLGKGKLYFVPVKRSGNIMVSDDRWRQMVAKRLLDVRCHIFHCLLEGQLYSLRINVE